MEPTPVPKFSPLTQSISSHGKEVDVDIYEGDPGKWILEVVDQYGNSTVWNDEFDTDQAALDEAKKVIREEGIETLIGLPAGQNDPKGDDL